MSPAHGDAPTLLQLLAVGLLLVGFAFKVSAVPFHMWTPDAYEGAPPAVTGVHVHRRQGGGVRRVRARVPLRVRAAARRVEPVLWVIAAATMIVGTVVGVAQTNVKRMLAYSSIAHGGYLLVGAGRGERRRQGRGAVLPAGLRGHQPRRVRRHRAARHAERRTIEVRDYAGLWKRIPALAGADDDLPAVARRLPADRPASSRKWYVFSAAVEAGYYWLAIIGVLTSVVSVFFYLRIVVMMYMTEGSDTPRPHAARDRGRRPCARDAGGVLPRRPPDAGHRPRAGLDRDNLLGCQPATRHPRPGRGASRDLSHRRNHQLAERGVLTGVHRPQVEHHAIVFDAGDDRRRPARRAVSSSSALACSIATSRVGSTEPGALPPPIVDIPSITAGGHAGPGQARGECRRPAPRSIRPSARSSRGTGIVSVARPASVLAERRLERRAGHLVDPHRAHQRMAPQPRHGSPRCRR